MHFTFRDYFVVGGLAAIPYLAPGTSYGGCLCGFLGGRVSYSYAFCFGLYSIITVAVLGCEVRTTVLVVCVVL